MTSRPFASIGTAKSHRRNRIINTSQRDNGSSQLRPHHSPLTRTPANICAQTSCAQASSSPTPMLF